MAAMLPLLLGADDAVAYRHLCTFGSREGIQPPRILNRKAAIAALGRGEHPYGLRYPVGVTTDARGRVWITDSGTSSIHVFDRQSGRYQEFRKLGDWDLQQPSGIASDPQGRVFAADAASGAVFAFDEQGEFDRVMVKPGQKVLEAPGALALSADGRTIYVADPPRRRICALNREGEVNGTIELPADFGTPVALSVIANQVNVLSSKFVVGVFSPKGVHREDLRWPGIPAPTAFAYDPVRQHILIANPRWMVVEVFGLENRSLGSFGQLGQGLDQMQHVDALHVDRDGRAYLVDSHSGKVLVFALPQ